jgi:hypothetical protein
MKGISATCFVYGQTGTGKSFTMTGNSKNGVNGLIQHSLYTILKSTQKLSISYFEIYSEAILDLLTISDDKNNSIDSTKKRLKKVRVLDNKLFVSHLTENKILDVDDIDKYLDLAQSKKQIHPTKMNQYSPRQTQSCV